MVPFKTRYNKPTEYSFFPGHYATTDDDGRPFLILYTHSGRMDKLLPYGMSCALRPRFQVAPDYFNNAPCLYCPRERPKA